MKEDCFDGKNSGEGDLFMLNELLRTRRSIRKYQWKEVEKEKIHTILQNALLAPSSRSRRPWAFIVVTDRDVLQKLSKIREHGAQHIAEAPLCIIVAADPEACDVWVEDASIASIIIQLSAHSLGLGSCWIQARERFAPDHIKTGDMVKGILSIPEKYEIECLITIGYPAEEKKPYNDSDLEFDKLHFEKW